MNLTIWDLPIGKAFFITRIQSPYLWPQLKETAILITFLTSPNSLQIFVHCQMNLIVKPFLYLGAEVEVT